MLQRMGLVSVAEFCDALRVAMSQR
jgi:hypothetical protein